MEFYSNVALRQLVSEAVSTSDRRPCTKLSELKNDKALIVHEVAQPSPASLLGIQKGDLILKINGEAALDFLEDNGSIYSDSCLFEVLLLKSKEILKFRFNGLPLGIVTKKKASGIIKGYKWYKGDPQDLLDLWDRDEDRSLIELAKKWEKKNLFKWAKILPGRLADMFCLSAPEELIFGVALYESGKREQGMVHIENFNNEHRQDWTTNFGALGIYYQGVNQRRLGNEDEGRELIEQAFAYCPLDRIEKAVDDFGGEHYERMTSSVWQGNNFPCDYVLPVLEGTGKVSLKNSLSRMKAHELLVVCSMSGYRSNGPYDDFMYDLIRTYRYFDNFISEIHVVTTGKYNYSWLEGETKAVNLGLPISILHDEKDVVSEQLESSFCPDVYFLDKRGTVVSGIKLDDEVELWELIHSRVDIMMAK